MVADYFAHIVSLAFCLFFVIGTGQLAFSTVFDATTLSALPIPVGPAYGLVPLGFAVLTALMLVELPRVHKGESLLFAPLTPAA
jgi:TRAP-type C4-dicarboxylate transport system permease small subunit